MMRDGGTDRDHGYQDLKKRWTRTHGRVVVVGIFGKGAAEEHDDGVTNLLVAIIHEFGAPKAGIPSRSWLRAFVDEKGNEIRRRVRILSVQVLKGQLTYDQALGQLGAWIVGAIQARIASKIPPPLKDATVGNRLRSKSRRDTAKRQNAQRGGGSARLTPLIDTGQFRQAITFEVRNQ